MKFANKKLEPSENVFVHMLLAMVGPAPGISSRSTYAYRQQPKIAPAAFQQIDEAADAHEYCNVLLSLIQTVHCIDFPKLLRTHASSYAAPSEMVVTCLP